MDTSQADTAQPRQPQTYPCPECEAEKPGNNRGTCRTCNRFASQVRREVARRLRLYADPTALYTLTRETEIELSRELSSRSTGTLQQPGTK